MILHHKSCTISWVYIITNLVSIDFYSRDSYWCCSCRWGETVPLNWSFHGSHLGGVSQSMWNLWWTKWHWNRFFSEVFGFPLLISFHCGSTYSYITWSMKVWCWWGKLKNSEKTLSQCHFVHTWTDLGTKPRPPQCSYCCQNDQSVFIQTNVVMMYNRITCTILFIF
jgi:hypothetical protein